MSATKGIVCNKRGEEILVLTPGNMKGNWRRIDFEVRLWEIVDCEVVGMLSGIQLGETIILPQEFKCGQKFDRSRDGTEAIQRIDKAVVTPQLPVKLDKRIEVTCTSIGLALRVCAENIRSVGSELSVWAPLKKVGNGLYCFAITPGNLKQLVSFRELWQIDATIVIRAEEKAKACGIGTVKGVECEPGTLRMMVKIAAKQTDREDAECLDSDYDFLLEVPRQ